MAKIIVISYIGTYYAISSVWILTLASYFSSAGSTATLTVSRSTSSSSSSSRVWGPSPRRTDGRSLIGAFFENLTWLPPPDYLPRLPLDPCQLSHRVPCAQHRHTVGCDKQRGGEHDIFGRGVAGSGKIQVHDCILFCHDSRYGGVKWSRASQVCVTRDQSAA